MLYHRGRSHIRGDRSHQSGLYPDGVRSRRRSHGSSGHPSRPLQQVRVEGRRETLPGEGGLCRVAVHVLRLVSEVEEGDGRVAEEGDGLVRLAAHQAGRSGRETLLYSQVSRLKDVLHYEVSRTKSSYVLPGKSYKSSSLLSCESYQNILFVTRQVV